MPKNYKVGDRVCCIEKHDSNSHIVGQVGTVRALVPAFHELAIEFDNDVHGHTLASAYKCPKGVGGLFLLRNLFLLIFHLVKTLKLSFTPRVIKLSQRSL